MHHLLRLIPALLLSIFAAPAPASADWPTYQGSPARGGVVSDAPPFAGLQRRFTRRLDGQVYAQPLIVGGRVYVATENNSVYAFTTSGRPLFRRHLGRPVPGHDLPCGNIDPSGITGTPAIAGNRLYVVAYLARGHHHVLYGLDAVTGRVAQRVAVDPSSALVYQQRGALLVDHGRVYVPYGGLDGDCGDYHGVVLAVGTSDASRGSYLNPSSEAGIWAPGGISEDPGGSLLVATGNGAGGGGPFRFANSVLRLSPTLERQDYWAPSDWASLSGSDTDIGSVQPLPLPGGRSFQTGKGGVGYVLNQSLGQIGGEAFRSHICDGAYGAPALSPPYVLVPCHDSLVALKIAGDRFSIAWRSDGKAATPIIAGDTVLYIQPDAGRLIAVGLRDGHPRASQVVGSGRNSFPAPGASGGLVVVPAGSSIVGFGGA